MSALGKGLGKGFDALMPTEFDQSLLVDVHERVQKLFTSDIIPNPDQPRRVFDEATLGELTASVRQYGILQPLIVSPSPEGGYRIIAGERRWRAAKGAGLKTVPAIVRDRRELEELEIALIENVQRVDLSPLEQAISIARLHEQFNLSYKEIAKKLAKAETTISNMVRLLQLPDIARQALQAQQITEGHARAILSLKDNPAAQKQLLTAIIQNGWSVRQAEQFATSHKTAGATKEHVAQRMATQTPETKRLGKRLATTVSIKRTARGGRLEIHFKNDEQLAAIMRHLK